MYLRSFEDIILSLFYYCFFISFFVFLDKRNKVVLFFSIFDLIINIINKYIFLILILRKNILKYLKINKIKIYFKN